MMKYYNIKAVDQSNNKKSIYNIYYNYLGDYYGLYISKRSCTEISAF